MTSHTLAVAIVSSFSILASGAVSAAPEQATRSVERGKYLVQVSGCNDCHTPGYMQMEGNIPESAWLTGSPVGFQGPWGTTYPVNLRRYMEDKSEAQWIAKARQPTRPPMPWFNLRQMSDKDLTAIYRYVRALGPAGEPAPAAVAPGQLVNTPYVEFVPKNLPPIKQASH